MTKKKVVTAPEAPQEILMTSETIGKDLLGFLIQELKAAPKAWQQMNQAEQNDVIDRARLRVTAVVSTAINLIFGSGCVSVIADVEGVAIKDHIKCILKVSRTNPSDAMQELFSAHNQPCRILLSSPDGYLGGIEEIKGEDDQGSLPLDQPAATDDPLIEQAIAFCRDTNKASISALQRHLRVGYNRAARIIISLEDKGIISAEDNKGVRTVFPVTE